MSPENPLIQLHIKMTPWAIEFWQKRGENTFLPILKHTVSSDAYPKKSIPQNISRPPAIHILYLSTPEICYFWAKYWTVRGTCPLTSFLYWIYCIIFTLPEIQSLPANVFNSLCFVPAKRRTSKTCVALILKISESIQNLLTILYILKIKNKLKSHHKATWINLNEFSQSFDKCSILTPDIRKQPQTSIESL